MGKAFRCLWIRSDGIWSGATTPPKTEAVSKSIFCHIIGTYFNLSLASRITLSAQAQAYSLPFLPRYRKGQEYIFHIFLHGPSLGRPIQDQRGQEGGHHEGPGGRHRLPTAAQQGGKSLLLLMSRRVVDDFDFARHRSAQKASDKPTSLEIEENR